MNDRETAYSQALENPYEQTQWQILIDGKPIQTLGEYDVSDTISAREYNSLLAQC